MTDAWQEMTVGERLKRARKETPLNDEEAKKKRRRKPHPSQQEMATRIGVDRETYNKWERGKRSIAVEYIPRLVVETGKPPEWFRKEEEPVTTSVLAGIQAQLAQFQERLAALEARQARRERRKGDAQ